MGRGSKDSIISKDTHHEALDEEDSNIRNVYVLGLVSFFTDMSSEMVFSVLPVFILGLLGGNIATLGFIEGIAEAFSYTLRAVFGVFSDKFRRRKHFIIVGYALAAVAFIGLTKFTKASNKPLSYQRDQRRGEICWRDPQMFINL